MTRAKPTAKAGEGINRRKSFYVNKGHAYFRRARAHEAMRERVDGKVRTGVYAHVKNEDDVEVYRIVPREDRMKGRVLSEVGDVTIENAIVMAACQRDWKTYKAALAEFKHRALGKDLPTGTSQMMLNSHITYIHDRILRRGGPGQVEIQRELAALQKPNRIITGVSRRARH